MASQQTWYQADVIIAARKLVKRMPQIMTCRGNQTAEIRELKRAVQKLDEYYKAVFAMDVESTIGR